MYGNGIYMYGISLKFLLDRTRLTESIHCDVRDGGPTVSRPLGLDQE